MSLLDLVRKPSTLNGKAPYFLKWQAFCRARGLPIFLLPPWQWVLSFLNPPPEIGQLVLPSTGVGPFLFSVIWLVHPILWPTPFALRLKQHCSGKSAWWKLKSFPCFSASYYTLAILHRHLAVPHTLRALLTCFHMALMYEGCLRWHDLAQIQFGDIIITSAFLTALHSAG